MDDAKWERLAALGGIWFVVLSVIGAFLPGAPPAPDDSNTKIANYFADHAGAIKAGIFLTGLGLIGLFWWLGTLWRVLNDAEAGRPRMAVVAAASLAAAGALALASGAITSTLALQEKERAADVKFFYVLSFVMIAAAGFALVAHIAAATSLSFRKKIFSPVINVVGWIAALFFLIAGLGVVSTAGALNVVGLLAFLVWGLWIVLVSIHLWRRNEIQSL
jgi:hypothetical protein